MSVPSMVHRSGDTLVVRSVVSGDALYGSGDDVDNSDSCPPEDNNKSSLSPPSANVSDKDLPECKVKRNYSCGHCEFFTQNPRSYLYHLRDIHSEKIRIYACPKCVYASKHFQKLLRHTKMVHGGSAADSETFRKKRPPPQPVCEGNDESNESHTSTEESQHIPDEDVTHETKLGLKCTVCSFVAKTHVQLNKHEKEEHIKTRFFRCSKCTYVTHMKARYTKHVKYHSMPMIKCDMCDFRTPYKWNLDRHCKNHNGKGAFRCSACNFTADIKQSLTVHEMNHHVPPVGHVAVLGGGRRRNKVGASDTTAAEEAAAAAVTTALQVQLEPEQCEAQPSGERKTVHNKLKIPAKKLKSGQENIEGDFVHPDDIIQHANGNVYIKSKCKRCNYKTAWDIEMARHEERVHGQSLNPIPLPTLKRKPARPVPNLIPIKQPKTEIMSQKDMNEICARSRNSALKDFAKLFNSEDMLKQFTKVPEESSLPKQHKIPHKKQSSFFDSLKEKLPGEAEDLKCRLCGYESKCLTEYSSHQKTCGKESPATMGITSMHKLTSTRCQYCRQRCKSSMYLMMHLKSCPQAIKYFSSVKAEEEEEDEEEEEIADDDEVNNLGIVTEEENSRSSDKEPHPMENRVFVWNTNMVYQPMDAEMEDTNNYESVDEKQEDYIDLSTRTQSPSSECSVVEMLQSTTPIPPPITTTPTPMPTPTPTTDKIPTHGNDISVAQHKRVFKCPHCTFWASTASRFHVHIVGHLNKKPFECSLCSYRSNWRWDITKHIKLKSVRDPAHESAKVLMTDETGRRNYTKYNKYLTEIHVNGGQDNQETSGGMGTRPRQQQQQDLPKVGRAPSTHDFSSLLVSNKGLRPPPPLKPADEFFQKFSSEKKQRISGNGNDGKKTLWQCKKCNFRDPCKDKLLAHVRSHYTQTTTSSSSPSSGAGSPYASGGSGGVLAGIGSLRYSGGPMTIGDFDTERHCRLKHSGDIKVIVGSKQHQHSDKVFESTTDTSFEEPEDVQQIGSNKCPHCPFSNEDPDEFHIHMEGHSSNRNTPWRCLYCNYAVNQKEDLFQHLKLHGITSPSEFLHKIEKQQQPPAESEPTKRYKCIICPYVTNSKSQFTYHKQFHKPNGQYTCTECSYNVSKRHLLHQHMKVHGINISPQKQNGETIELEEISDEIEEIHPNHYEWQNLPEIPLVWVSKSNKFSKMYKCRYCPHVNLRKVNIQEHEKMHGLREKNPSKGNETEHKCVECNYVCNNAGVLSSHSKVHQGYYGMVHGIVDNTRSDDEQIKEMEHGNIINDENESESMMQQQEEHLYFCSKCPARFLKENEYEIHVGFHGARLAHRCESCTYTARQKPHLLAHAKVHTNEYQERTNTLLATYSVHPDTPKPELMISPQTDVWIIANLDESVSDVEMDIEYSYSKSRHVPLSGTELFQQKSEAEANEKLQPETSQQARNGNPQFNYPSYLKNGKLKEKRYKCPKCPSVFEKREQLNVHQKLHGSDSQYKCTICDYSVKYYANFQQHQKNHNQELVNHENEEESKASNHMDDKKQMLSCSMCPFSCQQKDELDDHQKGHIAISGISSLFTCEHCDYSVEHIQSLKDHRKVHFMQNKTIGPEAFMVCDQLKLTAKTSDDDDEDDVIYEGGDNDGTISLNLNNNEGEKVFVNTLTGDMVNVKTEFDS
ncbi:PREDICTED: uncharacterized protein LOC108569018 isoform X2 [Nicrophorus vespilloides]|uniref:Uncharacterized protein LOC108569018 isoform X2 n=1 Tax=Nicrophorus vespilloides TaxID=110193 RepID=A0ABM1NGG4_NICVS|nr:PREDICTED: uncharacterized protein LOC108569018 isoform X2 [Nicrophorus vespilloides]